MAVFQFKAMNQAGQEVKDEIEADSTEDALAKIRKQGFFVTSVKEKAGKKKPAKAKTDELAKGKAPVLRLGAVAFAWVVANLESGEEAEAKRRYLETKATFAERNAAMDAAGDAAFDEAKERNDAWEAFKSVVEAVGEVGFKVVVALARKAVGL